MRLFTTEQVSKYHPDKYADQISDAILDAYLEQDGSARVAVETLVKDDTVVVAGEITSTANVDIESIVRRVANKLRYPVDKIINRIGKQSPEISNAVNGEDQINAGDQGFMFGYATRETKSYLPFGFDLANLIIKMIEKEVENENSLLKGDAKTQVTVDLDKEPTMDSVHTIIISVCHKKYYDGLKVTVEFLREYVLQLLSSNHLTINTKKINLMVNPGGVWTVGGPFADCGVTGRKIVCDQYGGYVPVGGGAFSGKDPSKMDRTGAYGARKLAMWILEKFYVLNWVEIQIAYSIGHVRPISLSIKTDKTQFEKQINSYIVLGDYTPRNIIDRLGLLTAVKYETLAEGCHYYGTNW